MVFSNLRRTMCAPLQPVWVRTKSGICRRGYTCAKGLTEDECTKICLKKSKPKPTTTAVTQKCMEDIFCESSTSISHQSSRRTRRPRKTTPIAQSSEEEE